MAILGAFVIALLAECVRFYRAFELVFGVPRGLVIVSISDNSNEPCSTLESAVVPRKHASRSEDIFRAVVEIIPIALCCIWLVGINPKEVARVCLCLITVYIVVGRSRLPAWTLPPFLVQRRSELPELRPPFLVSISGTA